MMSKKISDCFIRVVGIYDIQRIPDSGCHMCVPITTTSLVSACYKLLVCKKKPAGSMEHSLTIVPLR